MKPIFISRIINSILHNLKHKIFLSILLALSTIFFVAPVAAASTGCASLNGAPYNTLAPNWQYYVSNGSFQAGEIITWDMFSGTADGYTSQVYVYINSAVVNTWADVVHETGSYTIPTTGSYVVNIYSHDGSAWTATGIATVSGTVACGVPPPTITSAAPANGTVGVFYSHTFAASGSPAPTFSISGTLPNGITFDGVDTISGTPTVIATFNGLSVTASNGNTPNPTQNFSITINGTVPTITSAAPANGTVGVFYSHTFTASGNPAPTFSVSGTLPNGITFDGVKTISGTPTVIATFNGLSVTASNGNTPNPTQNFSITINGTTPIITSAVPQDGTIGVFYSHTFTATGNPAPTFSVSGTLPNGITFNGVDTISGTPTVAATFNSLSVTASNGTAPDDTQNFSITINIIAKPKVSKPAAILLPEPPPAPLCTDTNFENPSMIRSHFTNDADRAGLNCRLIAANGSYMTWLGGPITDSAMVGDQTVLDLGVVAAADVFSGNGAQGFIGDVDICLKGSGYMIYMNANSSPRVPQLWSAWKTDAFPGYTCTTLYAPGTVILVTNLPH